MPASAPNLAWVRSLKLDSHPEFGAKLYELLSSYRDNLNVLEQQTNSNLGGTPTAPPNLQAITVTPTEVGHHISINHGAEFYRGLYYHVESADNPHFTNPFPEYSGPAREINLATGSRRLYFQAFASYQNSANTPIVYHGGQQPQSVLGGKSFTSGQSQGSGTGRPGEGRSGFGNVAYRGSNPPTRNP
jgi:hypothetical protein